MPQKALYLENPDEICGRLRLIFQKIGKNTNRFDEYIVVTIYDLIQFNCFTQSQHAEII